MSMFKVPLCTSSVQLTTKEFWHSVMLYHSRPHVVNRRLLAASQILFYKICLPNGDPHQISELFTKSAILYEMRKLKSIAKENITVEFVTNIVQCYYKNIELLECNDSVFQDANEGIYISIRILLAKNKGSKQCIEVVLLNKTNTTASFLAVTELEKYSCAPPFLYEVELNNNFNLKLNLNKFEDADTASGEWLADNLFPKLLKWAKQDDRVCIQTLSLITVDDYSLTYNRLKEMYANDLIQRWPSKTTTDPQKYVFEDLAIASYLICLWKPAPKCDIKFVDCGCGNGLLTYLLNQEGFKGFGIDIRKRPIWEIYPKETNLEVGPVIPDSKFPQTTWIIGNHSDELTPWIPVIALKSSPKTNYFVLPCCPYDFSGQKYIRSNTVISQYADYMIYIEKISKMCGFDTKIDKLRIPSTKKICLVGYATNISDKQDVLIKEIDEYIKLRSANTFIVRNDVEQVRNCTQIDKNLLQKIVHDIVTLLLKTKNNINKSNGDYWNRGASFSILSICQSLSKHDLQKLKKECGGVQTLLKNHRYLFEVEKGKVNLRLPYNFNKVGVKYRSKPCWYFRNHENGCLFTAEECAYMH